MAPVRAQVEAVLARAAASGIDRLAGSCANIVETLSQRSFVHTDFTISADNPPRSKDTILRIEYQYSKAFFTAQLLAHKPTAKDSPSATRTISISMRPGRLNIEESDSATSESGLLLAITDWLVRLAEDLSHTPAAREMADLEAQINDLSARIGFENEDELLEPEQRTTLIEWIRDLETRMQSNLEAAETNARALEKKIENLRIQVDALCVIVGSEVTKRGAFRAVFGRISRWVTQPENTKLLKNASEVVTKLLTSGDHH
jgi:hypothetical protein